MAGKERIPVYFQFPHRQEIKDDIDLKIVAKQNKKTLWFIGKKLSIQNNLESHLVLDR